MKISSKTEPELISDNPIHIGGEKIDFTTKAEHVGVLRSSNGNLPSLISRFTAHRRALAANLFVGNARSHRGNIAASLKLEKIFALPVLLSGLASLVLTKTQVDMIDHHYLNTLKSLLKTYRGTPQVFVFFIAGSLPGRALLHLRMFSLFNMIVHLPGDPLFSRAQYALSAATTTWKSWFTEIRNVSLLYGLPHPRTLLNEPLSKEAYKKLVKSSVVNYWEKKLREEAELLTSLTYFKPAFHSLQSPHPIIWTPRANPYEVSKAVIQLKMLSGRYKVAMLTKHWSPNKDKCCPVPECPQSETLEHLPLHCPHYTPSRLKLRRLWSSSPNPLISELICEILESTPSTLVQFILDASVHPKVILLVQLYGQDILYPIFHLTRTWCYTMHRQRSRLLGGFVFD